jgi:hypothetical protein
MDAPRIVVWRNDEQDSDLDWNRDGEHWHDYRFDFDHRRHREQHEVAALF